MRAVTSRTMLPVGRIDFRPPPLDRRRRISNAVAPATAAAALAVAIAAVLARDLVGVGVIISGSPGTSAGLGVPDGNSARPKNEKTCSDGRLARRHVLAIAGWMQGLKQHPLGGSALVEVQLLDQADERAVLGFGAQLDVVDKRMHETEATTTLGIQVRRTE